MAATAYVAGNHGRESAKVESELSSRKAALFELLLKRAKHSFDTKSNTHIFFYLTWPGKAPRGIGDYPDGAFVDYRSHATSFVAGLSDVEVNLLLKRIESEHEEGVRIEEARPSEVVQIGLLTSQLLHENLRREAKCKGSSLNELCAETISASFFDFDLSAREMSSSDVREIIARVDDELDHAKSQWVIRVKREMRARLMIFANEYKLSVPQVCSFLLRKHLEKSGIR
jgi:hypothetical protein